MSLLYLVIAIVIIFVVIVAIKTHANKTVTPKIPKRDYNDGDILDLIFQGNKIQAIKLYRELHQVDLATAKEAIDALSFSDESTQSSVDEIKELIINGKKIQAVKRYREIHGTGLKESKDAVDEMARTL